MDFPVGLPPAPAALPGSYDNGPRTYRSLTGFIRERRQRLLSRERDVGLRWRDGSALYRAAWVEDTGELYLVQLGSPEEGGGHVELLATGVRAEDLETALAGYGEAQDAGEHSVDWLRRRAWRLLTRDARARRCGRRASRSSR